MNIYRASDGAQDTSPLHPADFPTLPHLRKAISNLVDIPLEHLVLFLEDGGRSLDECAFEDLWEKGGEEGVSEEPRTDVPASRLSAASPPYIVGGASRKSIGIFAFDNLSFQIEDVHAFVAGLEDSLVLCDISGTLQMQDLSVTRSSNAFGLHPDGDSNPDGPFIPESGLPTYPVLELDPLLPFRENLEQVEHLRERMSNQLRALGIAGANLNDVWNGLMGVEVREVGIGAGAADEQNDDPDRSGSESEGDEAPGQPAKARLERSGSVKQPPYSAHGQGDTRTASRTTSWSSFERLLTSELAREESLIARAPAPSALHREEAISPGSEVPPSTTSLFADGPAGKDVWGMEQDMQVIKAIPIHPSFLVRRGGKGKEKEKADKEKVERRKMLGDYVNAGKMSTVRDSCQRMYDDHLSRFTDLRRTITDLTASINQISQSSIRLTEDAHDEAANIVHVVERLVEEASRIALEDPEVHWQSLRGLDAEVRRQVVHMTDLKNDVNLQLHIHLQQISRRQSSISGLPPLMSELEETLCATRTVQKTGFPHLERLRNMARAYGQTCVEVVWRKQIAQLLLDGSGKFAEGIAGILTRESERRARFAKQVLELLPPFEAESLGKSEVFSVSLDLSVRSGLDDPQDWTIGPGDVKELCDMLKDFQRNPRMTAVPLHGMINPVDEALERIGDAQSMAEQSISDLRKRLSAVAPADQVEQETQLDATDTQKRDQSEREVDEARLARETLQRQLENERHECDRLRLELEDKEAAELSRMAAAEDQERKIAELRENIALKIVGECAITAELAEVRQMLAASQAARTQDLAQISTLQVERSQILQGLSDARNDEEAIAARVEALQSELDSALAALDEARQDRDEALNRSAIAGGESSTAELAQVMRDRAELEAKLDRVALAREEEKALHNQAIANAKRPLERELNGLNAELGFARAEAREEKRKFAKLQADTKASESDTTAQHMKSAALASRGLQVASTYHDCIARLQSAIQSSATISGSVSGSVLAVNEKAGLEVPTTMARHGFHHADGDLETLERELALLEGEDLQPFSEAVSRTMGLVKKWQKSAKQYRDRAKNAIAFSAFTKGDLALFLPTRNATTKPWAAFNISSPHNFLKPEGEVAEQIKSREWLVARITRIEESVASSEMPETNPYGLADGIRYQLLYVEPYNPTVPAIKRRNTEGSQRPQMPHPASSNMIAQARSSPTFAETPPRRVSKVASSPPMETEAQDNVGNPFEGPIRSNISPASPTRRSTDIGPAILTADLPFALRSRGEGMIATRRPSSIASSSGSFGRNRKGVGSVGKAAASAGVVSTADGGQGMSLMGGRNIPGRATVDGSSGMGTTGRRESATSSKVSGTAAEALRKLGGSPSGG